MDDARFDALVRSLSAARPRRALLGAALAALLAGQTGGAGATHGTCRHPGVPCQRDGQCCSRSCSRRTKTCLCAAARQCPATDTPCKRRVCWANGTCGAANATGSCPLPNATGVCDAGTCTVATCAAGFADCDGRPATGCEADTLTSAEHCGGCGKSASPTWSRTAGPTRKSASAGDA